MDLPDTDNIHFQHAYKKGYRLALEGKKLSSIPSMFRQDMELRDYFQQGFEQAQQDIVLSLQHATKTDWRYRLAWFIVIVIGSISTTLLLIHNIQQEQARQAELISGVTPQPASFKPQSNDVVVSSETLPFKPDNLQLSLLSEKQRIDLMANQMEAKNAALAKKPLEPIISSPIKVTKVLLENAESASLGPLKLNESIPKSTRALRFTSEIENGQNMTLTHRWRFNEQIIATHAFKVEAPNYEAVSSTKMSSAWQGTWYIEILNNQKEVIYRYTFQYGTKS